MEIIAILLPLLVQLLPLILDKSPEVQKQTFLRWTIIAKMAAQDETATGDTRLAAGVASEIFSCLAAADQAGRETILAAIQAGNAGMVAARGAA